MTASHMQSLRRDLDRATDTGDYVIVEEILFGTLLEIEADIIQTEPDLHEAASMIELRMEGK